MREKAHRGCYKVDLPEESKEAVVNLIDDFRLWDEIRDYVRTRLLQFSMEWNEFEFVGEETDCGNKRPHPPHVIDFFDKGGRRYAKFCLGREGPTWAGELVIIREEEWVAGERVHVKGVWRIWRSSTQSSKAIVEKS